MKDIDFDELDRAVNSLMKTAPNDAPQPASDTVTSGSAVPEPALIEEPIHMPAEVTTIDSDLQGDASVDTEYPTVSAVSTSETLASEEELVRVVNPQQTVTPEPATAQVEELAPLEVEEPPVATPSLAASAPARTVRRGRFMDMVRPGASRDARPGVTPRVSRQGVSLQPAAASTEALEEEVASQIPDAPSDFMMENIITQEATEDTAMVAEAPDDTPPLTSPFLSDAKVEKRPLGRAYEPTPVVPAVDLTAELAQNPEQPAVETYGGAMEDSISPNKDAQIPEQPLPAELGSELLNIETSTENLPPEPQPVAEAEVPSPSFAPESGVSAVGAARVMATASIPQQYRVQTSKAEEVPTGAIYDSQPLTSADKQRPKWLWVAIFAAIVLLGAAGGAAVYYLGLI